ncbi:MAG: hypothetical protein JKY99_06290 [Rhizobiales bacterium]|nr:hypothetical protein [Hyphomicrobiales bacterium]
MSEIDATAGEYVLGTLSEVENAEFEALLASDTQVQTAIGYWATLLSPLLLSATEEAPRADLKERIIRTIKTEEDQQQAVESNAKMVTQLDVFRRSRNRWRGFSAAGMSLAAGIAAFVIVDGSLLEPRLTVSPVPAQLAVLSMAGSSIQIVATIDPARQGVHIRPIMPMGAEMAMGAENPFAKGALQMWVEFDGKQLLLGNVSSKKWQWLDYSDILETDEFTGAKFLLTANCQTAKRPPICQSSFALKGRSTVLQKS